MPRVMPSVVVAFIDKNFPGGQPLGVGHSAAVAALLALIDRLPEELLQLGPDDFANFLANSEALRDRLSIWRSGGERVRYYKVSNEAVTILRGHLSKCPDQSPAPATTALAFIPDADLRESIRLDISSANSDLADGRWKGSTVLAGSAVEALLLWALQQHQKTKPGEITAAVAATLKQNPGADLEGQGWHLHGYVEVAAHLCLVTAETATLVRLTKDFRNLIHPGRAARLGQKCDRATALTALAAVDAVARDLTP